MPAVKVIQILGTSEESWEDAAQEALHEANQSVDDISGIEVTSWTADVEDGEISQYKATADIAFHVKRE